MLLIARQAADQICSPLLCLLSSISTGEVKLPILHEGEQFWVVDEPLAVLAVGVEGLPFPRYGSFPPLWSR